MNSYSLSISYRTPKNNKKAQFSGFFKISLFVFLSSRKNHGKFTFKGEPINKTIGFMKVEGIDKLYEHVSSRGWRRISDVVSEPWGGKTCEITTIDGSMLRFFEV